MQNNHTGSCLKNPEMEIEKYKCVTIEKLLVLLKKEVTSVIFEVRHIFELFDTDILCLNYHVN